MGKPNEAEQARLVGHAVSEIRGQAIPAPQARDGLTVAIGTAPQGLSLASETRLAKAALLYADRVVLYSPNAALLSSAENLGKMGDDALIAFVGQLGPSLGHPDLMRASELFDSLRRKRHRTRDELVMLTRLRSITREGARGFAEAAQSLLDKAGASELAPGLEAGLIEIDPLVTTEAADVADAYFDKLRHLLTGGNVYPLFDDEAGELVRASIADGLLEVSAGANRRGKQVAAATGFLGRMPALPSATMAQVIEVRDELREPLTRFRAAVTRLTRLVQSDLTSDDLAAEIQDLYDSEVAPALEDIAAAFTRDAYLQELLGAAFDDVKSLLISGAGLVAGVVNPINLPGLASAALGVGAAVAPAATTAAYRAKAERNSARHNQLYFLYEADKRLRG